MQERHHFDPNIFYWIDYSCFDQSNIASNLAMLPLWVACCERFVRYETFDYHDRAWCRLEILLSHAFGFADHHVVIDETFRHIPGNWGIERQDALSNPSEGGVTNLVDAKQIGILTDFAVNFAMNSGDQARQEFEFGNTMVKSFQL